MVVESINRDGSTVADATERRFYAIPRFETRGYIQGVATRQDGKT
jgi:hypothetical protein